MLINNTQMPNAKEQAQYMTRHIGTTTYRVRVHFNETAKESMEEKILRMIQNDVLPEDKDCGTIKAPQMSRPA